MHAMLHAGLWLAPLSDNMNARQPPCSAINRPGAKAERSKQGMKDHSDEIEAALAHDMSIGRSFPVHGLPSFRIVVRGSEVFADHDEPQKPEHNQLRSYPSMKRYLDEQLDK